MPEWAWGLLDNTCWLVRTVFLFVVGMLGGLQFPRGDHRRRWLNRLAWELKPFYLPALGVNLWCRLAFYDTPMHWLEWILQAMGLVTYLFAKHFLDDDDRWKRRAKKARDAIKRVGSRLVVVPAPVGAR